MTLNGYFALNSVSAPVCLASDLVTLEDNYCLNSRTQAATRTHYFCADTRAGSLENRRQRTVRSRGNARFEHIFLAFENNYVKRNADRPIL